MGYYYEILRPGQLRLGEAAVKISSGISEDSIEIWGKVPESRVPM